MTDKELFLNDLNNRVPQHIFIEVTRDIVGTCDSKTETIPTSMERMKIEQLNSVKLCLKYPINERYTLDEVKPILRSIEDMTEEEVQEYDNLLAELCVAEIYLPHVSDAVKLVDWLYEHKFDVHGLIEKGLAIRAPKGLYK